MSRVDVSLPFSEKMQELLSRSQLEDILAQRGRPVANADMKVLGFFDELYRMKVPRYGRVKSLTEACKGLADLWFREAPVRGARQNAQRTAAALGISPDVLVDSASVEYLGFLLVQAAFLSVEDLKILGEVGTRNGDADEIDGPDGKDGPPNNDNALDSSEGAGGSGGPGGKDRSLSSDSSQAFGSSGGAGGSGGPGGSGVPDRGDVPSGSGGPGGPGGPGGSNTLGGNNDNGANEIGAGDLIEPQGATRFPAANENFFQSIEVYAASQPRFSAPQMRSRECCGCSGASPIEIGRAHV